MCVTRALRRCHSPSQLARELVPGWSLSLIVSSQYMLVALVAVHKDFYWVVRWMMQPTFVLGLTGPLFYLRGLDLPVLQAKQNSVTEEPDAPDAKVCIYVMHPRGPMSRHYLAGYIPPRGMALFGHDGRYLNNDSDCLHERLLLDIAAGMQHLRDLGYDTIVGVGNSPNMHQG